MFTPAERDKLRSSLLVRARQDLRITGAAVTGSVVENREDEWSDIDLAFGVADAAVISPVLSDWTEHMYAAAHAVHHVDVRFGAWIYRVFLLANTLQVDLAFAPASEFRALGSTFRLMFGRANEPIHFPPQKAIDLASATWPLIRRARHCIDAGRLWEAEYLMSTARDSAMMLACLRLGLPSLFGKGADNLPPDISSPYEAALLRAINIEESRRALERSTELLVEEVRRFDGALAAQWERDGGVDVPSTAVGPAPARDDAVGFAWLYALHARSSIARQKPWQAEYMISGIRDHVLSLACFRHGLPATHARGADDLPSDVTAPLEAGLVQGVSPDELRCAFAVTMTALIEELRQVSNDPSADRLIATVQQISSPIAQTHAN